MANEKYKFMVENYNGDYDTHNPFIEIAQRSVDLSNHFGDDPVMENSRLIKESANRIDELYNKIDIGGYHDGKDIDMIMNCRNYVRELITGGNVEKARKKMLDSIHTDTGLEIIN